MARWSSASRRSRSRRCCSPMRARCRSERSKVMPACPAGSTGVGLLLTIAAGAVLGALVAPELGWAGCGSHRLGPCPDRRSVGYGGRVDAAVPVRIRRALNIESGLNDGIATPFVTVFLAAVLSEEGLEGGSWALDAFVDIGLRSSPRWSSEGSAAASSRWPRAAGGPPRLGAALCLVLRRPRLRRGGRDRRERLRERVHGRSRLRRRRSGSA